MGYRPEPPCENPTRPPPRDRQQNARPVLAADPRRALVGLLCPVRLPAGPPRIIAETRIVASIVRARDSRGQDLRSPLAGRVAHVPAPGGAVTTPRPSRRLTPPPPPAP